MTVLKTSWDYFEPWGSLEVLVEGEYGVYTVVPEVRAIMASLGVSWYFFIVFEQLPGFRVVPQDCYVEFVEHLSVSL